MLASLLGRLRGALAHPATRGLALDDPATTARRRAILREKPLLEAIHLEWYRWLAARVPGGAGVAVELGAGGGFLRELIAGLVTSDVSRGAGAALLADACALPFEGGSLRALAMVNVLHHLPEPERFLAEAVRCLRRGGALLMVEPWLSPWSRFVYRHLQDEPCAPEGEWRFASSGALSGANLALPWILLARDRERFSRRFPELVVDELSPTMPFAYLLSGGVATRWGAPGWSYRALRALEQLGPLEQALGIFARIRVTRR